MVISAGMFCGSTASILYCWPSISRHHATAPPRPRGRAAPCRRDIPASCPVSICPLGADALGPRPLCRGRARACATLGQYPRDSQLPAERSGSVSRSPSTGERQPGGTHQLGHLGGGGVGIGLVPREAVKLSGRHPLSIIAVDDSWAQRDLKICTRRKTPLSPFAQALIDHLLAE